jgi:hypothetical protein
MRHSQEVGAGGAASENAVRFAMISGECISMLAKVPTAYKKWDITSPDLSPRSRLYPLEPIGVGTPLVESLTGYIARLAEAHCVSTGMLYKKEIDALTGKGDIFTFRLEGHAGYSTHNINGRGVPAADFVRALESLTRRPDLRYLTMLPWAEVLPAQGGLQRRARGWCAQCLCMWQADTKPLYEPLLWTLKPVTLCTLHQQALCFLCPLCKRQNRILDPGTRPGHCSRCGQRLAPTTADTRSDNQLLTNDELQWKNWTTTVLGEVLASAPRMQSTPARDGIARLINSCVERITDGNASAFARLLEVGYRDIRNWQTGKALPKVPLLLGLSYRLGMSLPDLLRGAPTSLPLKFVRSFPRQFSQESPTSKKSRRPFCRIKLADLLQILQAALNESPPPSVRQVVKRTNHVKPTIYLHFREECHAIAQRFAEYRRIQAVARKQRLQRRPINCTPVVSRSLENANVL